MPLKHWKIYKIEQTTVYLYLIDLKIAQKWSTLKSIVENILSLID